MSASCKDTENNIDHSVVFNKENKNTIKSFLKTIRQSCLYAKIQESEQNTKHISLLSLSFNDFYKNSYNILHFIYILNNKVKNGHTLNCILCHYANSTKMFNDQIEKIATDISINKKNFAIFFNSFFHVPFTQAQKFFYLVKLNTNTKNGMFPFDLSLMIIDKISYYQNIIKSCSNLKYFGVVYPFAENANLDNYVNEIYNYYKTNKKLNACLIQTTGKNVNEPIHFCGIFIDFQLMNYFFYNSLAKPEQLNLDLFKKLKMVAEFNNLTAYYNNNRQQYDNSLCGIFSSKFIFDMAQTETEDRVEFFNEHFNFSKNLDKHSEQFQVDYISPNKDDNYLFNRWLNIQ